uniref:UPF0690 protein C1orf52 homolog n=1 Tax=Bursaphelenchus xylophilus TaxID=6326 RepID=A0A1I7RWL5_BURXY
MKLDNNAASSSTDDKTRPETQRNPEQNQPEESEMSGRKNHNGCFGTPPSVNFFTSVDEDSTDISETEKQEVERLAEQAKRQQISSRLPNSKNWTLKQVDSEIFDPSPFKTGLEDKSAHSHVVSSPYESPQYPIEIQETKKAIQRQIDNRWALKTGVG